MMAETQKAKDRRDREGFFDKFCQGNGIDIGAGDDPIIPGIMVWDIYNGDATHMLGMPDGVFDFVYSSHCLEHVGNPYLAIKNWWRILRPGGHLIVFVPHRDFYEKRIHLPSRWNGDHKCFFLPEDDDLPCTLGLRKLLESSLVGEKFEIIYVHECAEGHTITKPDLHSDGEYSIEAVIRKL
jgi:SAM-dependent methyltransferase